MAIKDLDSFKEIHLESGANRIFPEATEGNVGHVDSGRTLAEPDILQGPLKKIYAFWLAGMSCDGCSVSVTGATSPSVESLLLGTIPGLPKLILYHPVLAAEAGANFVQAYHDAAEGKLDAPYVVILEGSAPDESISGEGYWSAMGAGRMGDDPTIRPIPVAHWLRRLAPGAAAAIAIGTCATWGGIPSAVGNPTGAMSLMDFLGADYRSAFGLPVVNIPGCAPVGDNFTETVAAVLLFLQGLGPLPAFDELGRPQWLFGETVHRKCLRGGYYEEGSFAHEYGGPECLVELGCWGPIVNCNITSRGAINHMGGCMNTGAPCIGCTMPGFPDKFSPFYKAAPGSMISSTVSRTTGTIIHRLRRMSNKNANREVAWDRKGAIPSGWGHVSPATPGEKFVHYFYEKLQFSGAEKPGTMMAAERPGRTRGSHQYPGGYEVPAVKADKDQGGT